MNSNLNLKTIIIVVVIAVVLLMLIVSGINKNDTTSGKENGGYTNVNTNVVTVDDEINLKRNNIYEEYKKYTIDRLKNNPNENEYFKVLEIMYEEGKYLASIEHVYPMLISVEGYAELVESKIMYLEDAEYVFKQDGSSQFGYVEVDSIRYDIVKEGNGYIFKQNGSNLTINDIEFIEIILDENTSINDKISNKNYLIIDDKAKEWLYKSLDDVNLRLSYTEDKGLMIDVNN